MAPTPWGAYALLFASMSLVGTYVALSKPLVTVFPVFLLAALRFGIAAVAMIPWTRGRAGHAPLGPRLWRLLFLQSFFGNFLFSICMLYGISMTSAVAAGVVLATLPACVALLSWLLLRERIGLRVWLAVVLAVAGVALLALAKSGPQGQGGTSLATLLLGLGLLVGTVICEALYVVIGKKLSADLAPLRTSALINLVGLCLMLPLGLWQASTFDFATVQIADWSLLVFYALSASVFSVWLWMSGLRRVPAGHSGVFTIALPLASTLVGVFWLGEPFSLAHAGALGLAMAGVLLVVWPRGVRAVVH
jgi:drug/metabolite transporter (DMT)-like permease